MYSAVFVIHLNFLQVILCRPQLELHIFLPHHSVTFISKCLLFQVALLFCPLTSIEVASVNYFLVLFLCSYLSYSVFCQFIVKFVDYAYYLV